MGKVYDVSGVGVTLARALDTELDAFYVQPKDDYYVFSRGGFKVSRVIRVFALDEFSAVELVREQVMTGAVSLIPNPDPRWGEGGEADSD